MTCAHCCYACGPKGEDMSLDTFRAAIANDYDEMVSIGGGEPTIHPHFWEIMGLSLGHYEYVWLATNGKNTETALALARMAKKGVIGCALSQDAWHSKIDQRVIDAFSKDKTPRDRFLSVPDSNDQREIQNVGQFGEPILAGRCDWGAAGCVGPGIVVQPSGMIKACACEDAPTFGKIQDGITMPEDWMPGECWQYNRSENPDMFDGWKLLTEVNGVKL